MWVDRKRIGNILWKIKCSGDNSFFELDGKPLLIKRKGAKKAYGRFLPIHFNKKLF